MIHQEGVGGGRSNNVNVFFIQHSFNYLLNVFQMDS